MESATFNNLNHNQKEAVKQAKGPSLILAGAGSGKTRVLTNKVFFLTKKHKINPSNILMITFTNKAAEEMKNRVFEKLGFIGTFHSLCVKILRIDGNKIGIKNNFLIYDSNDQQDLIKEIIKKMDLPKKYSPSFVISRISSAKNQLVDAKSYKEIAGNDYLYEKLPDIYEEYEKKLIKSNALDFDDLLFKTVSLFKKNKLILEKYHNIYKYILVDEFQDTNFAQYQLTKILAQKNKNLTVVGDFSQSIYSWRGAEIKNLEKLKDDFPDIKTFYLEENYRSTQNILDFAFSVISKNASHPVLKLYTKNKKGEDVEIKNLSTEQYEGLYVAEKIDTIFSQNYLKEVSIGVLYRINAQSRVIEESLLHLGIPYVLVGGTRFYERKEVKDVLSYIRLIVSPDDEISLKRVLKIGKKRFQQFQKFYENEKNNFVNLKTIEIIDQILEKTKYLDLYNEENIEDYSRIENIKELRSVALNFPKVSDFLDQVALVESEYSQNEKNKKDSTKGVKLMTLHQAKGLEFDYVFIVGVEEGILPHARSFYDVLEMEEERRLFYVGITRARVKLFITHTRNRFFFGKRIEGVISRFLEEKEEGYDF